MWNQKSTQYCEPATCCFNKRDILIQKIKRNFWKITDGGPWHVHFVEFMTISRSYRFIYLQALFNRTIHKSRMYRTWWVLVANVATNFWILVASMVNLDALAIVSGTISCPEVRCPTHCHIRVQHRNQTF